MFWDNTRSAFFQGSSHHNNQLSLFTSVTHATSNAPGKEKMFRDCTIKEAFGILGQQSLRAELCTRDKHPCRSCPSEADLRLLFKRDLSATGPWSFESQAGLSYWGRGRGHSPVTRPLRRQKTPGQPAVIRAPYLAGLFL